MRFVLCLLLLFLIMPGAFAFGKSAKASDVNLQVQQADSKYTFEDNNDKALNGKVVKLKKGTVIPITLQTPIDTSAAQIDDTVEATLDEDLEYDGAKIAEKGSVLYGTITKARSAKSGMRGGKVTIKFNKMITTNNQIISIASKKIEFIVRQEAGWVTAVKLILTVAVIGAYIVMSGGTAVAAIAACVMSGSFGAFEILNTKGTDAVIPVSTPIEVSLDSSLNAMATY